jgi:glutaminase
MTMTTPDYLTILTEIAEEIAPLLSAGKVVDYIEPLKEVPQHSFGMALYTVAGHRAAVGLSSTRFSIQSIAKVFPLALAMQTHGDAIWARVGREPSGTSFNSLVQLEFEQGIPRNPFINAGALVTLDATLAGPGEGAIDDFVRRALGSEVVRNERVAQAEAQTGHRNRALAHFLKSFGSLTQPTDQVLDAYFRLCAVEMSCDELAKSFLFLANHGLTLAGDQLVTRRQAKRINSVMVTCGAYDEAGDYAYRVGLPAKTGVGGGVVAVLPGHFSVAVWSPGLNEKGNSLAGTMALELLTTKTGLSIF